MNTETVQESIVIELVRGQEPGILEEGRLTHAAVPTGSGHTVPHCLSYYGYREARSGDALAKQRNELGLQQALRYAAALGNVPTCLGGGFNDEPSTSPTLERALATGAWKDAAMLEAQKQEPPAPIPGAHKISNF